MMVGNGGRKLCLYKPVTPLDQRDEPHAEWQIKSGSILAICIASKKNNLNRPANVMAYILPAIYG